MEEMGWRVEVVEVKGPLERGRRALQSFDFTLGDSITVPPPAPLQCLPLVASSLQLLSLWEAAWDEEREGTGQ